MTVQTTTTYNPHDPKESLAAALVATQAAVEAAPVGSDWHTRATGALNALRALRDDYNNRRVDGA